MFGATDNPGERDPDAPQGAGESGGIDASMMMAVRTDKGKQNVPLDTVHAILKGREIAREKAGGSGVGLNTTRVLVGDALLHSVQVGGITGMEPIKSWRALSEAWCDASVPAGADEEFFKTLHEFTAIREHVLGAISRVFSMGIETTSLTRFLYNNQRLAREMAFRLNLVMERLMVNPRAFNVVLDPSKSMHMTGNSTTLDSLAISTLPSRYRDADMNDADKLIHSLYAVTEALTALAMVEGYPCNGGRNGGVESTKDPLVPGGMYLSYRGPSTKGPGGGRSIIEYMKILARTIARDIVNAAKTPGRDERRDKITKELEERLILDVGMDGARIVGNSMELSDPWTMDPADRDGKYNQYPLLVYDQSRGVIIPPTVGDCMSILPQPGCGTAEKRLYMTRVLPAVDAYVGATGDLTRGFTNRDALFDALLKRKGGKQNTETATYCPQLTEDDLKAWLGSVHDNVTKGEEVTTLTPGRELVNVARILVHISNTVHMAMTAIEEEQDALHRRLEDEQQRR